MNSRYPEFGCLGVVFLILSFHFVNKNPCVIYFPHYFVNTLCTHTLAFILEVNFYFSENSFFLILFNILRVGVQVSFSSSYLFISIFICIFFVVFFKGKGGERFTGLE
jgi:hypothetical protein